MNKVLTYKSWILLSLGYNLVFLLVLLGLAMSVDLRFAAEWYGKEWNLYIMADTYVAEIGHSADSGWHFGDNHFSPIPCPVKDKAQ